MSRFASRFVRQAGLIALFVATALGGLASGVLFAYMGDLPQISALDNYAPSTITRVVDRHGELVGDFAIQRRVVVDYDDISPTLRHAIVAAEDAGFNSHFGLSALAIVRTAVTDVLRQRMAGASTLTQQLARNLFPIGFEKTLERKIKEAILAIQIEKRYTKREILTFYCNQVYVGHGAYGVEAAARMYFGKAARDVTLEEAALIAGIIQTPSRQSPFVSPERARIRRNYVLQRMAEEGYITQAEADAAKEAPIRVVDRRDEDNSVAPFFLEEIRKRLEAKYGAKPLYEGGLVVQTSMDAKLQRAATRAVQAGLRQLDKRRGFRRPARNIAGEGKPVDRFQHERWRRSIAPGDIVPAVVTGASGETVTVRVGRYRADLDRQATAWTGRRSLAGLVNAGDLVEVRVNAIDEAAGRLEATLEQEPLVDGALLAIENRTGRILAMVGGYSFQRSQFNRATQAYRQVGSLFKAILYSAAIDGGLTPTTMLVDAPASFEAGPNQPPYEPRNYDGRYEGPVTLRHALEKSRNIPAVRVMERLGPARVVQYARRFGLERPMPPFLSVALGSAEHTLLEMTSAFSVFPNQGIRMEPYFLLKVSDREGKVLEENRSQPHDAIRADTAYVMTSLLRGVILRGTAARAASLDWPLAGKTGTVDDYTDAWFVGFDPNITVGVWVGYDQKRSLGRGEEGATAALPIWIEFMRAYIEQQEGRPEFSPPGNIVFLTVDRATGELADPEMPGAIREAFVAGTEPGAAFFR